MSSCQNDCIHPGVKVIIFISIAIPVFVVAFDAVVTNAFKAYVDEVELARTESTYVELNGIYWSPTCDPFLL